MRPNKPDLPTSAVQIVLQDHWEFTDQEVSAVGENGYFSTVYYFKMNGCEYVILFNQAGQISRAIRHFEARLPGAMYFKGMNNLRFYAKIGYTEAYVELCGNLLALPMGYEL